MPGELMHGVRMLADEDDRFAPYGALLEKIDRRIGGMPPCPCPPGCDRCCRVSLTLFPVEAFHLREAFLRLRPAVAQRVARQALAARSPVCPFLLDGACAVYASRPVLCRLHGYPFLRRVRGEDAVEIHGGCECLPLEAMPVSAGGGTRKVSAQDLDGTFLRRVQGEDAVEIHGGCECLPLEAMRVSAGGGTRTVSAQDLDGINGLLAMVNDVFCKQAGLGPDGPAARIAVSAIPGARFPEGERHADL
jgi:Fe-S-cluster containining protein